MVGSFLQHLRPPARQTPTFHHSRSTQFPYLTRTVLPCELLKAPPYSRRMTITLTALMHVVKVQFGGGEEEPSKMLLVEAMAICDGQNVVGDHTYPHFCAASFISWWCSVLTFFVCCTIRRNGNKTRGAHHCIHQYKLMALAKRLFVLKKQYLELRSKPFVSTSNLILVHGSKEWS